jgi:hypothetical protein
MDEKTRVNFINIDKNYDYEINYSKLDAEIRKRKNEHYDILKRDDYANFIIDF